jgi:GAF domain-containing protein
MSRLDFQLATHLVDVAEMINRSHELDETMTYLVQECAVLTGVHSAGVLLGAPGDGVRDVALSNVELAPAAQIQCRTGRGPTVAVLHGSAAVEHDVSDLRDRWPEWSATLLEHGIKHVAAFPLRLVNEPVGGLELYATAPGPLPRVVREVACVFAGLALVVVNHETELRTSLTRRAELAEALESRIAVEQAKGYLCAVGHVDTGTAFDRLRRFARRSRRRVDAVAADIVTGAIDATEVLSSHGSATGGRT